MPNIDQPPPPMPWRDVLIGVAVFVAVVILAVASSGSFTQGVISVAFLFAILAVVAVHQMRSRKERFIEQAAKEPPRSNPVPDERIREVKP